MDGNQKKEITDLCEKVAKDLINVLNKHTHLSIEFLFASAIGFVFEFAKSNGIPEEKIKIYLDGGFEHYKDV